MKGKIVELISGSLFSDKKPRVKVRIEGAEAGWNNLIIPAEYVRGDFTLDSDAVVTVASVNVPASGPGD